MNQGNSAETTSVPHPNGMSPEGLETYLLSESALAKDWLRPEEEEAWQDL